MSYYYEDGDYRLDGLLPEQVDTMIPTYDKNADMGWDDQSTYTISFSGGELLARYDSSEGSSHYSTSSPTEYYNSPDGYYAYSPTHTVDPYSIHYGHNSSAFDSPLASTPRTNAVSLQTSPSTSNICCEQCPATFKRRADLKRHKDHIHDSSELTPIYCDYAPCARSKEPFKRKDHFRDHLRDYHKEDVKPRGSKVDDDWYADRNISRCWWRCVKCLVKVSVKHYQFTCPRCQGHAGKRRQEIRQ